MKFSRAKYTIQLIPKTQLAQCDYGWHSLLLFGYRNHRRRISFNRTVRLLFSYELKNPCKSNLIQFSWLMAQRFELITHITFHWVDMSCINFLCDQRPIDKNGMNTMPTTTATVQSNALQQILQFLSVIVMEPCYACFQTHWRQPTHALKMLFIGAIVQSVGNYNAKRWL